MDDPREMARTLGDIYKNGMNSKPVCQWTKSELRTEIRNLIAEANEVFPQGAGKDE